MQRIRPTAVPRKCVELHVLGLRTYGEIAKEMRLPICAVKSHIARAVKKLRTLLGHVLDSSDPDMTPLNDDGAAGEPGP